MKSADELARKIASTISRRNYPYETIRNWVAEAITTACQERHREIKELTDLTYELKCGREPLEEARAVIEAKDREIERLKSLVRELEEKVKHVCSHEGDQERGICSDCGGEV